MSTTTKGSSSSLRCKSRPIRSSSEIKRRGRRLAQTVYTSIIYPDKLRSGVPRAELSLPLLSAQSRAARRGSGSGVGGGGAVISDANPRGLHRCRSPFFRALCLCDRFETANRGWNPVPPSPPPRPNQAKTIHVGEMLSALRPGFLTGLL